MDLRYALRLFRRSPQVSAIIVLTLALCIGANTAIFSVIDATLLRPLPYPDPDRLVSISRFFRGRGAEGDQMGQDGRTWELIRDHANLLDAAVYSEGASGVNFVSAGGAQYVKQQRVGAGFFRVLSIPPLIGREFTRAEDRTGGPALTVLSHHLWTRIFRADPAAIGQSVMLRGEPYIVIGVMPAGFHSNAPADLWTPLRPSTSGEGEGSNYEILGRLKPDATWAQADTQLEAIGAPLFAEMKLPPDVRARLRLLTLQRGQTEELRKPLYILWAAVGLVLLIGCANVTSLLLARAATRSREIATRMAIGGGRGAIVRQLLMESLVLAFFGGLGGVLVGFLGVAALKSLAAGTFPFAEAARLDARVLAAAALLSLLASLLAGVFPAFESSAVDIRMALSEAGGRGVTSLRKRWSRRILVTGEVALATLLLIGAGILVRTLTHLYRLRPGFDPANVITASFSLQDARYATAAGVDKLFHAGLDRIRALPGVESAATGLSLPYQTALNGGFWRVDGPEAGDRALITDLCYTTPDFFATLRIPLLRGRTFRESDGPSAAGVVIVNDAFVRKYLARQEAVGSHIGLDQKERGGRAREIVGVIGDVQQKSNWGSNGPLGATPTVYLPVSQTSDRFVAGVHTWFSPSWVVRASGSQPTVIRGIQSAVSAVDPLLPIAAFHTIQDLRAQSLAWQQFQATLLAALSALALALAVVGIYGLMSQSVAERRRELGIRMALGSSLARAIREAAFPGILLALAGVLAGCLLAGLSAKVLEHVVWGVSATDPLTYAGVALGLLLVVAAASLAPALRIAKLNPADTLREE